jgi:hypothetical protein
MNDDARNHEREDNNNLQHNTSYDKELGQINVNNENFT